MSSFPPDGFSITSGTWGVDADQSTSQVFNGSYSIIFNPSSSAVIEGDLIPVQPGETYRLYAWVYETAAINVSLVAYYYDKSEAFITSTPLFSGALSATGVWEQIGALRTIPSTTRFVSLRFAVTTPAVFVVYLGWMGREKMPLAFSAYRSTDQTGIVSGVSTQIDFTSEEYDYGSNFDSTTNYRFDAPYACIMHFTAGAFIDAMTGYFQIYLRKNGSIARYGVRTYVSGTVGLTQATTDLELALGDYVDVFCTHNHGANRDLKGGSSQLFFNGHEIRGTL